ncbi:hypothetical protein Hanom_Chr17g01569171 [Helianthus anomalus]
MVISTILNHLKLANHYSSSTTVGSPLLMKPGSINFATNAHSLYTSLKLVKNPKEHVTTSTRINPLFSSSRLFSIRIWLKIATPRKIPFLSANFWTISGLITLLFLSRMLNATDPPLSNLILGPYM